MVEAEGIEEEEVTVEGEEIEEVEAVVGEVMKDKTDIMKLQKSLEIKATPYEVRKQTRKNSQ